MNRKAKPLWDEVVWRKNTPEGRLTVREHCDVFYRKEGRSIPALVIEVLDAGQSPGFGSVYASLPIEGVHAVATTSNIPKDIIKMFLTIAEVRRGAG